MNNQPAEEFNGFVIFVGSAFPRLFAMKIITAVTLGFCSLFCPSLAAQDVVLAMSGREYNGQIIDDAGFQVILEVKKKSGKTKTIKLHKSDVFSVTKSGQTEQVFYLPDVVLGDDLSIEEVRIYIAGEKDAADLFNVAPTFWIGVGLAAAGGWFSNGGLATPFIVPVVYSVAQFIPVIKIKGKTIRNPAHKYNDIYASGYEKVARSKKLIAAIKGSGAGMVIGVVAWQLIVAK